MYVCKLLTHWECEERNKSWNKSLYYYSDISHFLNKVVILTDLKQGICTRIKYQELWKTEFEMYLAKVYVNLRLQLYLHSDNVPSVCIQPSPHLWEQHCHPGVHCLQVVWIKDTSSQPEHWITHMCKRDGTGSMVLWYLCSRIVLAVWFYDTCICWAKYNVWFLEQPSW